MFLTPMSSLTIYHLVKHKFLESKLDTITTIITETCTIIVVVFMMLMCLQTRNGSANANTTKYYSFIVAFAIILAVFTEIISTIIMLVENIKDLCSKKKQVRPKKSKAKKARNLKKSTESEEEEDNHWSNNNINEEMKLFKKKKKQENVKKSIRVGTKFKSIRNENQNDVTPNLKANKKLKQRGSFANRIAISKYQVKNKKLNKTKSLARKRNSVRIKRSPGKTPKNFSQFTNKKGGKKSVFDKSKMRPKKPKEESSSGSSDSDSEN